MNKKILNTILLMNLILLLSINTVFAYDNAELNQPGAGILSTSFVIHGGHGEWGYGLFNMWGKYWHVTKEHRVVLSKDNSFLYGAWEGAGATPSYREASRGRDMGCTGEIR